MPMPSQKIYAWLAGEKRLYSMTTHAEWSTTFPDYARNVRIGCLKSIRIKPSEEKKKAGKCYQT
jgi:hypothetical protein